MRPCVKGTVMARNLSEASAQFAELARNLNLVGAGELRQELYKAIDDAARPLAQEIGNAGHLRGYMPDRYAGVLASSLRITTSKRTTGPEIGVSVMARAPTAGRGGRKIRQLNDYGLLSHPLFGDREFWFRQQAPSVEPEFFTAPCEAAAPQVRAAILAAMGRVADKATGKG